ncbi:MULTISPECIES: hypothetical protein [Pasteurellaceae]|nr:MULTISPECIES: hypothetical protein [Pasteurellaceae]AIJ31182.1 hypothetical protein ASU1_04570 [Actinobacillus suis ATCC 33415]AIZ79100.1 hypothetical protein ACEE_04805 [Actinobacillus equuli subsp. equuli]EFL80077.1 hypothetical protein APP6_0558 [Actinobacillus pleuropneumoniae serovar 6 str. Femo]MCQ9628697.1 hypothetical protein [Actinobacillus suis]MCQ9631368.1 hypothetical protein [Actinobacillus suis]
MASSHLLVTLLVIGMTSQSVLAKPFTGFGNDVDSYIQTAANRYQVSETMLRGLVKMEDGWLNKLSPTGATGVGQFTVGTWNWLAERDEGRALGMVRVTARSRGTLADPRRNKRINTLAIGALARWHIARFQELGIRITDENLYMAHNIGLEGLHRALVGKSTKEDIRNMRLNGMKRWMTVNDFLTYQKRRYNTHKFEANFMQTAQKSSPLIKSSRPMKWVEPVAIAKIQPKPRNETIMVNNVSSQMKWIEPTGSMVWIEPTH